MRGCVSLLLFLFVSGTCTCIFIIIIIFFFFCQFMHKSLPILLLKMKV